MKIFDELTNKNFEMFAAHHYDNPECTDISEFKEDLSRFKYLKRLLRRYEIDKDLQEQSRFELCAFMDNYMPKKGFWELNSTTKIRLGAQLLKNKSKKTVLRKTTPSN